MVEALLLKVKEALKKAGLDEGLAENIEITEEGQIAAEITKLEAAEKLKGEINLTPEQLIAAVKEAGLENSFKKYLQSETDRRVTQAITTHELKLKREQAEKETKEEANKKKQENQKDMTPEQKTIANLTDQLSNLTNMVQGLSETTTKTKRETLVKTALKEAGLKEGFSKFVVVKDDEEIPGAVKVLKTEVLGLQQEEIDKKLKDGGKPLTGENAGSLGEETAKGFAESRNKGTAGQPFQGKELVKEEK